MIQLPDPKQTFEHENGFYLTCDPSRISKFLSHYELFKKTLNLPGAIVECGVFKGASFSRFALFRHLLSTPHAKKMIAFDAFGKFPETQFEGDKKLRQYFIDIAGEESIGTDQLEQTLNQRGLFQNVELVKGDICKTVPEYLEKNPALKISLLNLDTDILEPTEVILKYLYPRIVPGGLLILDDYAVFPGETKAVDDYFKGKKIRIEKHAFAQSPCYLEKPLDDASRLETSL